MIIVEGVWNAPPTNSELGNVAEVARAGFALKNSRAAQAVAITGGRPDR